MTDQIILKSKDSDWESTAYTDGYVARWVSNKSIPPKEILEYNLELGNITQEVFNLSTEVRDIELTIFLRGYVEDQKKFWTEPEFEEDRREHIAMARGALGPGQEVVNMITGHKFRT